MRDVVLPKVVYLDQNKWIEIARALASPKEHAKTYSLIEEIVGLVEKGKLLFPLNVGHLFETRKISNDEKRQKLSYVMTCLSKGKFFHTRSFILKKQVENFSFANNLAEGSPVTGMWFVGRSYTDTLRTQGLPEAEVESVEKIFNRLGDLALFDLLSHDYDGIAIRNMSQSAKSLAVRINDRRKRWAGETREMRRRAHKVINFDESQETIINALTSIGVDWRILGSNGGELLKKLCEEVPILRIEADLALVVESEAHEPNENDLRDFYSYSTALSVAHAIIGERAFCSRVRQTGLDRTFNCLVTTDLASVVD